MLVHVQAGKRGGTRRGQERAIYDIPTFAEGRVLGAVFAFVEKTHSSPLVNTEVVDATGVETTAVPLLQRARGRGGGFRRRHGCDERWLVFAPL